MFYLFCFLKLSHWAILTTKIQKKNFFLKKKYEHCQAFDVSKKHMREKKKYSHNGISTTEHYLFNKKMCVYLAIKHRLNE